MSQRCGLLENGRAPRDGGFADCGAPGDMGARARPLLCVRILWGALGLGVAFLLSRGAQLHEGFRASLPPSPGVRAPGGALEVKEEGACCSLGSLHLCWPRGCQAN